MSGLVSDFKLKEWGNRNQRGRGIAENPKGLRLSEINWKAIVQNQLDVGQSMNRRRMNRNTFSRLRNNRNRRRRKRWEHKGCTDTENRLKPAPKKILGTAKGACTTLSHCVMMPYSLGCIYIHIYINICILCTVYCTSPLVLL